MWSGGLSREEVPSSLPKLFRFLASPPLACDRFYIAINPCTGFPPPFQDKLPDLPHYIFIL